MKRLLVSNTIFNLIRGLIMVTYAQGLLGLYLAVILLAIPIIIHGVKHEIKRRKNLALIKAYQKTK